MAAGREIICEVCGAANPPPATDCSEGGMKRKGARKGRDVEKLLEELIEKPDAEGAGKGEEGLDLDKEIVDELLDSLLVEASAAEAEEAAKPAAPARPAPPAQVEERFECPVCGTSVEADAKTCPSCGALFEAPGGAYPAEAAEEPAPEAREEAPTETPGGAPAVAVSETETSKVSALRGRLIALDAFGALGALIVL